MAKSDTDAEHTGGFSGGPSTCHQCCTCTLLGGLRRNPPSDRLDSQRILGSITIQFIITQLY